MFQKPAFGANTTNFGSFSAGAATASPFGGFKPAAGTSAFSATPAFGAAPSAQPTTGGGLFGTTGTTGGLFGTNTPSTSTGGFGTTASGFGGFGASTGSGGLFGGNTTAPLFGNQQSTPAFGAKPSGFGFGTTTSTTGATGSSLFGSTPATGTGLFGQQNNTMGGGGLFSNNTGAFGQPQQTAAGTAHAKYNPVVGTDVVVKSGTSQNINIKHHCITCMKEYENKSLEELRLEDYVAGRKGAQPGGMFGGFQQPQAENKPLFGGTSFGQPATTSSPSVFGGGTLGGAGAGFGQSTSFAFGGAAPAPAAGGLFGAAKPAFGAAPTTGTGLFGGSTTTQPLSFGTSTPAFGFGTNTQTQQQSGGLFGAKPATAGFGTAPASSGFGAFGTGGGLFAAKTTAPTFGTTAPSFGTGGFAGGFGTSTSSSGGLFGANSTFGKPATTQPTFGFNTQPTLGTGLGTGLGANTFQAKPAAAPFGQMGTTNMFQNPTPATTFKTGMDSGLGSGLFSNTSLGGGGLGLGGLSTSNQLVNNSLSGASAVGNVHEQILNLAARPYGDSPLFKDLVSDTSTTAEDVLKPTNPAAMKAVLDSASSAAYRVTSPTALRLKVHPRSAMAQDKKSLFDGLEESDASLEDKLSLKPSRKRLVLRPKQRSDDLQDSVEQNSHTNRSLEEARSRNSNAPSSAGQSTKDPQPNADEVGRARRQVSFPDNNTDLSSDRHGSWLSSPMVPWNEKEKSIDGEPTPRLYPSLDKELPAQISERRASWLTTKPLRKPLVANPDSAENSVRELGVRSEMLANNSDKENIDTLSVSEEEVVLPRDCPPHPTGVKLTRPGYYTIPSLDEMIKYMRADGSCVVPHLTIGRRNYGNVFFDCEFDVAGLDLDALVHFLNKEIIVYPEDADKPPVGEGLNRRAVVTLDRIWPRDKTERRTITNPDRLLALDYEGKLRRVCDKHDTKFIEYRPATGSWVFRVEHFSKYGLTDSDEEDDAAPDVLRRQLVNQGLQKAAAPAPKPPVAVPPPSQGGLGAGLGGLGPGLGGLGPGLGGLAAPTLPTAEDNLFAMQQTSLNLLNGASKAFDMDTTEDNAESQSLYLDNRAYGVKSPTTELARLEHRQSHHVQLMKASLYADTEMEDDISVSTGDQLVPDSAPVPSAMPHPPIFLSAEPTPEGDSPGTEVEEMVLPPLIVRPQTIVLRYHRKVPPFKKTIAGRLGAAYIADMSVCRARHSRIGFGPAGAMAYATSYDSVNDLPKSADLCDLGKYVRGRARDDWSEPNVLHVALGRTEPDDVMHNILKKHLESLLEYSSCGPSTEDQCPRWSLSNSPQDRRAVLQRYIKESKAAASRKARYGVSGAYCHEVWELCDALWGADLENDGLPGTDDLSVVSRHRRLLQWLRAAGAAATDRDLARPTQGEAGDESDGHSTRVWTLVLGGRVLEACRLARDRGDLNMAALVAQAAGDPSFRSLVARQLSQWRECGADALMSSHRWATLHLVAGLSSPRDKLFETDWLRALHATARYLCPQVPTLEQVLRTYEGFFPPGERQDEEPVDLSLVDADDMSMRLPLPPYVEDYDVSVLNPSGRRRRVLDLRYDLLRARAYGGRPRLQPAAYTPDPMDYSLCFLLGTWFGSPSAESVTGVADQLEARGDWHRAVQALAYHPDDVARGHLIRGVVSRNAPARAASAELQARLALLERLHVPSRWLRLAQAHRAQYEHLPAVEAEHLVGACQWNAAHKVLLDKLLPDAVLAVTDDLQSIAPLLEKMHEAAQRHEVSGWETGGQALYHYLHVCDEIRGLVSSAESQRDRAGVQARLEALRPTVLAACRALAGHHPKSARARAARAEMGGRLVQLALAAGCAPAQLAAALRALRLPPDCTHAHRKITTDLAERASELCIQSASTSPLSSQHRQDTS